MMMMIKKRMMVVMMMSNSVDDRSDDIHLFHNAGLLIYSFMCMIISLSDLV